MNHLDIHVAKFGGTSVANFERMQNVINILKKNKHLNFVVISAIAKMTNILTSYTQEILYQSDGHRQLKQFIDLHMEIIFQLPTSYQKAAEQKLKEYEKEIIKLTEQFQNSPASFYEFSDQIITYGELTSTMIFEQMLKSQDINVLLINAGKYLKSDNIFGKANIDFELSRSNCHALKDEFNQYDLILTQGFMASNEDGLRTTLGREGSDYSASLFTALLEAHSLEIWTDVEGMYHHDPRHIETPIHIPIVDYDEAIEISHFGAKVLHHKTLFPIKDLKTKLYIRSTLKPDGKKTLITNLEENRSGPIAFAIRDNQTKIGISTNHKNGIALVEKLSRILDKYSIQVDFINVSFRYISMVIDESQGGINLGSNQSSVLNDEGLISELEELGEIDLENDLTLLTFVGKGLSESQAMSSIVKLFEGLSIKKLGHGHDHHGLSLLFKSHEKEKALERALKYDF